ncbi:MAG TPA: beta-galactosidase trimerization domain-containing protein, partial [Lacipirellulaceae bacterium]|nr:beta-galactosidase trimerization domain-containing protein [Lacipirellulaceae bacterium]
EDQERFIVPVTGFYKALVESHFQVDFVFDETANLRLLNEFAAIVLPNVAVLSDHECDAIRQYVHQGGVLIATLDSSRFDRNGEPLGDFALRDVFGASFQRKLDCDNAYFRNIPPPFESAIDPRQFVLCPGPILMINPTTATTYGDLHTAFHKRLVPQQFFSHNIHPPHDRIGPALCVNRFGKGTCVYLPFGLDRAYGDFYELAEHRQLIEAIVRAFAPPPLVDISAPLNCEATLRYDADCLYVHLTMFNALRQNVALPTLNRPIRPSLRMEEPASYTATLRPEAPFTAASVVHGDADLDHDETTVTVRCQDVYVVIAITFGGKS